MSYATHCIPWDEACSICNPGSGSEPPAPTLLESAFKAVGDFIDSTSDVGEITPHARIHARSAIGYIKSELSRLGSARPPLPPQEMPAEFADEWAGRLWVRLITIDGPETNEEAEDAAKFIRDVIAAYEALRVRGEPAPPQVRVYGVDVPILPPTTASAIPRRPCYCCEAGFVEEKNIRGRTFDYRGERLTLDVDVRVPVCDKCGEIYFRGAATQAFSAAMERLRGEPSREPTLEEIVRATLADFHWTPNEIVRHIEVVRARLSSPEAPHV